jgi:hypothetical protein
VSPKATSKLAKIGFRDWLLAKAANALRLGERPRRR